jgi:hypothetical protein
VACAVDPHKHLVQVPYVPRSRTSASQLIGILLPALQTPLTDRLIRHNDPTGEPELFDIALGEARTGVQPDTMANDLRGEAVVFIAVGRNGGVHATIMAHRPGAV